jgi:hypothetical protein
MQTVPSLEAESAVLISPIERNIDALDFVGVTCWDARLNHKVLEERFKETTRLEKHWNSRAMRQTVNSDVQHRRMDGPVRKISDTWHMRFFLDIDEPFLS